MKLVHFDSQRKSTFILWLRAHTHRFVFCFSCFTFFRAVCIKKWFVSVDISSREPILCVNSRHWMNGMAEWIRSIGRCIYGFSNCSRTLQFGTIMQMCGKVTRALQYYNRVSTLCSITIWKSVRNQFVSCISVLEHNTVHAYEEHVLQSLLLHCSLTIKETQNLNIVKQWVTVYGITINLRKFIEYYFFTFVRFVQNQHLETTWKIVALAMIWKCIFFLVQSRCRK